MDFAEYTEHQDLLRDQHVFACTLCTNCRTGMGRISTGMVTGPYLVWWSGCRDDDAKAVTQINDPAKHLLSCSVTFVGPIQQAKVRLTAEILRQGKSVTTIEVR